jgi:hypothetical protein
MKDGEHCSDIELLLATRTSAEAFGVFYERHFPSVLTFSPRDDDTWVERQQPPASAPLDTHSRLLLQPLA